MGFVRLGICSFIIDHIIPVSFLEKIKLERGENLCKASAFLEVLPGEGSWVQTQDRKCRYRNLE